MTGTCHAYGIGKRYSNEPRKESLSAGLIMGEKRRSEEAITAGELLSRLQKDPAYVRMMQEKDAEMARNAAEFAALEAPILSDLHKIGVHVASIGDSSLLAKYMPLSEAAVKLLLDWAPKAPSRVQECVVRLLAAVAKPYDGRPLAELFDRTESSHLRWVIANTFEAAGPLMIADWLDHKLTGCEPSDATGPLFRAFVRVADPDSQVGMARALLNVIPDAVAPVLGKLGTEADIGNIERQASREESAIQRKLAVAVQRIRRRASNATR
jgi:hypothetical protein